MIRRAALLLLLLVPVIACNRSGPPQPPPELAAHAPDTLIAELVLGEPDTFWSRLRTGGADALQSLPDTAAGVVAARAKLELRLARMVSGGLPFYAALGESEGGGMAFGIAMKLRDARGAERALTEGDNGRYVGKPLYGMTVLSNRSDVPLSVALALTPSGYLVLASSEQDLGTFGAYAARTLPRKAAPSSALQVRIAPGALAQTRARATNLAASLTSMALRAAAGALPRWFDANAFSICVNPMLKEQVAMVGDLADATIDVDNGNGEIHAVATLTPKGGDNAARQRLLAMHPGDASPLLDTPRDALAAWFVSDTQAQRAELAAALGPCLERALGGVLGADGDAKLGGVMDAWAKGRGDWDTVSLVSSPPARGVALRAASADADVASRSLHDLADLLAAPPARDTLEQTFGVKAGVVQQTDVPPFGKVDLLAFPSAAPAAPRPAGSRGPASPPPPFGLSWAADAREVNVGVGFAPKEILAGVKQPPTLGSDGPSMRAVRALGTNATFAAVLRPPGCCKTGGTTAGPITLGWGKKDDLGWMRLEIGYEIVARFTGSSLLK